MPTQGQFNTTMQPVRNIEIKINVLDRNFEILDEISGIVTNGNTNIDADSDVRRTASISMVLKSGYTRTSSILAKQVYWFAGNPYWFDKYIKIEIAIENVFSGEYEWVNQGLYMIDSPSINYNVTNNTLSFQAVDLMCRLTGLRNGQLEGMVYTVPSGSSITGAMESILLQQGFTKYILFDPPIPTTPYDVNIDLGGTAFELLSQLRDINPNWEMFFDINGVFVFQSIPSGQVVIDPATNKSDIATPLLTTTQWDKLSMGYTLDTDFSSVKNYVEVLGMTHTPNEWATTVVSGVVLTGTLAFTKSHYTTGAYFIGLGVNISTDSTDYTNLSNAITNIVIKDSNGEQLLSLDITNSPIYYENEYYILEMDIGTNDIITGQYLGFLQSKAIAFEANSDSPFYVGDTVDYTCATGVKPNFIEDTYTAIATIPMKAILPIGAIDIRPYVNATTFSSAVVGTEWVFVVEAELDNNIPIDTIDITYGDNIISTEYIYQSLGATATISFDFNNSYLLHVEKTGDSSIFLYADYFPVSANDFFSPTDKIYDVPAFSNQVRIVLSGDEYDNIYSNDLAKQRAKYEIYLRARLHDSINISSVPIYWLDVNQVIEYTLPNNISKNEDLWITKSISTDLGVNGVQNIQAMRYYPLYQPKEVTETYLLQDSNNDYLLTSEDESLTV